MASRRSSCSPANWFACSTQNEQQRAGAAYALRQAGADVVPLLKKEIRPELGLEHRQRLEKLIDELSPAGH